MTVDFSPIGTTGLPRFSGYIYDEWLPELQGVRGRRVLREMADNDPIIGAILFSLEMLIRQSEWYIEPGASQEISDFVEGCLHDMDNSWEDTLSEILTFFVYGFSFHEIVYKRRDGINSKYTDNQIGWQGWPVRGQETVQRWAFDPNGGIQAMVQLGPPDYVEHTIPMEKGLLFRTTTRRGSPEGRSLLRNAYRPWYFKKHIEAIEAIGIERDLAGIPVMGVPAEMLDANASPQDKANLEVFKQIVTNIRRDEQEGIVMPRAFDPDSKQPLYELKLLSTGGTRQFQTDAIIGRYDQRITLSCMADFLMLGHERVGSNAMAQSKSKMFTAALGAWLSSIGGIINNHAIPRLLRLNGMPVVNSPKLRHGDVERPDIAILGAFLEQLSAAGIQLDTNPHGELVRHLMGQARLPLPDKKDEEDMS